MEQAMVAATVTENGRDNREFISSLRWVISGSGGEEQAPDGAIQIYPPPQGKPGGFGAGSCAPRCIFLNCDR
ncbi:hypothetical protein ACWCYY_39505 [Kitasatospora sp. NPDC001664]